MIGRTLDHYKIEAKLGEGGMGVVYRGRDTHLDRPVAIKVLPAGQFADPQRKQRFVQEARSASALNHPNIVTIYDIRSEDSIDFIAMECIEGETLEDKISAVFEKGIAPRHLLRYAVQIADALSCAHAAGVLHRDLKPSNIMVTSEGRVKILDFGLAKLLEPADVAEDAATLTHGELTQPGTVLGTPSYMSPEQAEARALDRRSDIFSFGAVLYEMATGRRPFIGASKIATLGKILNEDPRPPAELVAGLPTELDKLILRCLRKDPARRYQSMADLKVALEDVESEPVSVIASAIARAETPSIAVLPFTNLSADKENEYFSDGLAEEILNALTQLPGLRVIARASAFAFRGREHAFDEIRDKLHVQNILQGSVRRSGNRVRVTAQLVKVSDESQLWSDRYDGEMTDVFAIQDEVAQAIVAKLRVRLASESVVKRPPNPEAHNLYLQGVFYANRFDWTKAYDFLRRAVEIDPGHARAWVQLAEYRIHRCFTMPASVEMPHALEAAKHALDADHELSAAHAASAFVTGFYQHRWKHALEQIEAAASLPPTTWYYIWGGGVFWANGRLDEAERYYHQALDSDPLSYLAKYVLGLLYNARGQYEMALPLAQQGFELGANAGSMALLGVTLSNLGRHDEGVEWLEKSRATGLHHFLGYLGLAYVRAGRGADCERLLAELESVRGEHYVAANALALCAMALGEIDRALDWISTAVDERDMAVGYLVQNAYFEPLRASSRYIEIMKRANLTI